jgi:DNA-binding CsgD family transcriptional regulator
MVRPAHRESFDTREIETAERLHPHLVRASRLASKLCNMERLHTGFEDFFEQSASAVFVVDTKGRLRHSNRAGSELISAQRELLISGGVLCAADRNASRCLHALIGTAGDPDRERRSGGSMSLTGPDRALPLAITVIPARSERVALFQSDPCVLVCAVDPETRHRVQEDGLRNLLGLSRAEAKVAKQLLDGKNSREAAQDLGLSYNTVRSHLARILAKTGLHHQSELIRLMVRATANSGLD